MYLSAPLYEGIFKFCKYAAVLCEQLQQDWQFCFQIVLSSLFLYVSLKNHAVGRMKF